MNQIKVINPSKYSDGKASALELVKYLKSEEFQRLMTYIENQKVINFTNIGIEAFPAMNSTADNMFKPALDLVSQAKSVPYEIHKNWLDVEKWFKDQKSEIKSLIEKQRLIKQRQLQAELEKEKEEEIKRANNLSTDMGLDEDQISDEQVRVMEQLNKNEKQLAKKAEKLFIKEKYTKDMLKVLGFKENPFKEGFEHLIEYVKLDDSSIWKTVKEQLELNAPIGINCIELEINKNE